MKHKCLYTLTGSSYMIGLFLYVDNTSNKFTKV